MPCGVCQEARETANVVARNLGKAVEEVNEALEDAQKKAAEEE